MTGISLNWELPSGLEATLVGSGPQVIFQGQRCLIYAQIRGQLQASDPPEAHQPEKSSLLWCRLYPVLPSFRSSNPRIVLILRKNFPSFPLPSFATFVFIQASGSMEGAAIVRYNFQNETSTETTKFSLQLEKTDRYNPRLRKPLKRGT